MSDQTPQKSRFEEAFELDLKNEVQLAHHELLESDPNLWSSMLTDALISLDTEMSRKNMEGRVSRESSLKWSSEKYRWVQRKSALIKRKAQVKYYVAERNREEDRLKHVKKEKPNYMELVLEELKVIRLLLETEIKRKER